MQQLNALADPYLQAFYCLLSLLESFRAGLALSYFFSDGFQYTAAHVAEAFGFGLGVSYFVLQVATGFADA